MKTQDAFIEFLEKVVNLNPDRVKRIKEAQKVLSDFIAGHEDFKDLFIESIPEGSSRQKTIIKPVGENGTFDADIMILLKKHPKWEPKDYLKKLADAFKASGRYEDITDTNGKTRCVTIDYEGEFHADLVPAIVEADGTFHICNKSTNAFEITDGDGYAKWFEKQNLASLSNLVYVVRLIKYLRDDKEEFNTKSIILTTIAANQISFLDAANGAYADIPTALTTVLAKMDSYLSQYDNPPSIANPAMPRENFNRHWKNDLAGFKKFKSAIKVYAKAAKEANGTKDVAESLKLWEQLFGDKFGNGDDSSIYVPKKENPYAVPLTPNSPWSY